MNFMKLVVFSILAFSVLLLGCVSSSQPQEQEGQVSKQSQPQLQEQTRVATESSQEVKQLVEVKGESSNASAAEVKVKEFTGGEVGGESAVNVYIKDSPSKVSNVELQVTKVAFIDNAGRATVLYSGFKTVNLNNRITTRIGSGLAYKGKYSKVVVEFAGEVKVTDDAGVHVAKALRSKVIGELDLLLLPGKTIEAVLDVTLFQAVRKDANGNYAFKPQEFALVELVEKDAVEVKQLAVLSKEEEIELKVLHDEQLNEVKQVPILT